MPLCVCLNQITCFWSNFIAKEIVSSHIRWRCWRYWILVSMKNGKKHRTQAERLNHIKNFYDTVVLTAPFDLINYSSDVWIEEPTIGKNLMLDLSKEDDVLLRILWILKGKTMNSTFWLHKNRLENWVIKRMHCLLVKNRILNFRAHVTCLKPYSKIYT